MFYQIIVQEDIRVVYLMDIKSMTNLKLNDENET